MEKVRLGVLGGGIMGTGIAAAFRRKDVPVVVYDIAPGGREMVERNLLREEVSGGEFTDQLSDLSGCNVVIESVVEKIDVKQELLKAVEDVVTSDCLIGSNTSTIPISRLASVLQRPDRFCGIHFLHPVRNRKLTEIVCGEQTAPATLDQADAVLKSVDQTPLWVKDCPGFVVNRLLQPYLNEALILLQEGVDMDRIDNAAVNFGMAWGPIKTMDEIGIDTTFNAGRVLYDAAEGARCRSVASAEWRRVVPVLRHTAGVSDVDTAVLHDYCVCVARVDQGERALSRDGVLMLGERGWVKNGWTTIVGQYRSQIARYIGELGLSPSARGRIQPPERDADDDGDVFD